VADKNEDEFFFGMLSRGTGPQGVLSGKGKRWTGTVDGDRGNRALDVAAVRLLKTQDVGYVRTVRGAAAKEVRQLEERVVALGGSLDAQAGNEDEEDDDWLDDDEDAPARRKPKKVVFTEGVAERKERIAEQEDEDMDDDDDDDDNGKAETNPEKQRAEQRARLIEKLQRRLTDARKKARVLAAAENELDMQRARMAKTATVGGVTKAGKKFKIRERKR
jgi:U3 small nucleolar RNA-associated protein 11